MRFISNILSTVLGIFVFIILFFILIIGIGAIAGGGDDTLKVKDNSVLELDLSKVSLDYGGKISIKEFGFFDDNHNGLNDVLIALKAAESDDKIKGISIKNNSSGLGMAQTKELRDALIEFKKSKKFILSYNDVISQGDYYLNSVADKVFLNPAGEMEFKGLSSEVLFYKNLQEKTGIKMEVLRHGKYKSAVEPFIAQEMSDNNREQITVLLNSVWNTMVNDIAVSRNIPADSLNAIANNLAARTPEMALEKKLIDGIIYIDEYDQMIKDKLKVEKDEDYESVALLDYVEKNATTATDYSKSDAIAVIYAQGEIMGGEGDVNIIGEGAINRSLKEAREDEDIKAIVLRVDSPGGSALASELIWREIENTKKVKPVVVSMGNYAASGGYYIACNATKIFAQPSTLTGSIGVFGVVPNMTTLVNNMGINAEIVKTHENAANYSLFTPMSDSFRSTTTESIERIYKTFVQRVAAGRNMSFEEVDALAQGRVWTGADALNNKLVDAIGSLDDAIAEAAKLGKTTDYHLETFPEYDKDLEELIGQYTGFAFMKTKEQLLKEELGEANYEMVKQLKSVQMREGIQARVSFELRIN